MSDTKVEHAPSWVKVVRSDLSAYERDVLQSPVLNKAELAFQFLKERAQHEEVEVQYGVALDAFGHVLGSWEGARGSATQVWSGAREVFRPAVLLGAVSVVAAHNHPSGEHPITPSTGDLMTHLALQRAGEIIGIEYLDSLVISGDAFVSVNKWLSAKPGLRNMLAMRLLMQTLMPSRSEGSGNPEELELGKESA